MKIFGVILAGGRGTRMGGRDKACLRLAGRYLAEHVRDRLAPQVAGLALNANAPGSCHATLGLPILPDSFPGGAGPMAGLLAGLEWAARGGADAVVSAAVDTPFFPNDLVERLELAALRAPGGVAVAAVPGRQHPTFGLWPVRLAPVLLAALEGGERRLGRWAAAMGAVEAQFPIAGFDPFLNINQPEDLRRAETIVAGEAAAPRRTSRDNGS